MKINKVLLGLFAGLFALTGSAVSAQGDFHEMGPINVGGHVTSLVADQRDGDRTTILAGTAGGGLFVWSENDEILTQLYSAIGRDASLASNHNTWHQVPYVVDGKEVTLPITTMVQGPDNTVFIGTGDNTYQVGSIYGRMSLLGKGIYRYNPETATFTMIPGTKPTSVTHRFAAVKEIDYIYRDNKLYLYAVTGTGLYRWVINNDSDWATVQPTEVFAGEVDDLEMVRARRVAYFTVGNQLYKIGDVTAATPNCVNVSARNAAFGGTNVAIKLGTTPNDPSYLYAMVIGENGRLENLYVTTDEQNWITLTTSTVLPLAAGAGTQCGTVTVDPGNPQRVYMAGTTIWSGEGFVPGSYYQWTKSSYYEDELNYGDYMSSVYSNMMFVHSGIHQILPVYSVDHMDYYIATDGGVYRTNAFNYFESMNIGLNNVQTNHLAVCPDGSVVSGAVSNSVLMMDARLAHNRVNTVPVWYDTASSSHFNHDANILFRGNGGHVAASKFQQVKPQQRRQIIVTNNEGGYGRTFTDYLDYTNTQTWTADYNYITNAYNGGHNTYFGNIYLWETTNNTIFDDTITFGVDTLGYVLRKRSGQTTYDTVWMSLYGMTTGGILVRDDQGRVIDTLAEGTGHGSTFRILSGDKMMVTSRAHSDYPFEYTFSSAVQAGSASISMRNPIQARGLIIGRDSLDNSIWRVCISQNVTDFTKVFNPDMPYPTQMYWYPIYEARTATAAETGLCPRDVSMSSDGRYVFIAINNVNTDSSMIIRVKGFENANYTVKVLSNYKRLSDQLSAPRGTLPDGSLINGVTLLTHDTLVAHNGSHWFPRQISSIRFDEKNGDKLIVTFENYSNRYDNVAIINNCTDTTWSVQPVSIAGHTDIPAYCSMVENTTGDLYIGTSDGVYFRHGNTWAPYNNMQGLTVTTMYQQQDELPVRHVLEHNGINPLNYVFARTKWTGAMYFGTYGRGIFIDMQYVTDTTNEVVDPVDLLEIPTATATLAGHMDIYPNPVSDFARLVVTSPVSGNGVLRIYDLRGRMVAARQLGTVTEGEQSFTIGTEGLAKGMYLVNVVIGGYTAVAKMMVR